MILRNKILVVLCLTFLINIIMDLDIYAEEQNMQSEILADIPKEKWAILSQKKFYFGHQSVGYNIIDGLIDVMHENPDIKLNVQETKENGDFKKSIFAHSRVGKNKKPKTKITEFETFLEQGIGSKADGAFLKFCYVDIVSKTTVNYVFKAYVTKMTKIQSKFPELKLIHFTVPLSVTKENWKTAVKKLLGRQIWEYTDNIKRNEFNELVVQKFGATGLVFDIAAIESTLPDGSRNKFIFKNKTYYSLYPGYSSDGSHLNKLGGKVIAEKLLLFLVNNFCQ